MGEALLQWLYMLRTYSQRDLLSRMCIIHLGLKDEAGLYSAQSSFLSPVLSDSLIPVKSFLMPTLKQLPSLANKAAVAHNKSGKEGGESSCHCCP